MTRHAAILIALMLPVSALAAQSSQEPEEANAEVHYIIDVEGKKVRAVGPRFLPNDTGLIRDMETAADEAQSVVVSATQ